MNIVSLGHWEMKGRKFSSESCYKHKMRDALTAELFPVSTNYKAQIQQKQVTFGMRTIQP